MSDSSSPHLKRSLGLVGLTLFGVTYMTVITVFTTYGIVNQVTDGHLPAAYVIAVVAMLFTAAKVTHLGLLPQGQPERKSRVQNMVAQHDAEGFGNCTNIGECTAVCPKGIPLETISRLNRDLLWL